MDDLNPAQQEQRIRGINCVLARLWILLIIDLNIQTPAWEYLISLYLEKYAEHHGKEKALNLKGNLSKSLTGDTLSWKEICRGITMLDFDDVLFFVEVHDVDTDGNPFVKEFKSKMLPVFDNLTIQSVKSGDTQLSKDDSRLILGYIMKQMRQELPRLRKNWRPLLEQYAAKTHHGDSYTRFKKLSVALSKHLITWNMFFCGLSAAQFSKVRVGFRYKAYGSTTYDQTAITLT